MTNKAVVLKAFSIEDPVGELHIVEKPIPEPKEGEVLVKITMRPVRSSGDQGQGGDASVRDPLACPLISLSGLGITRFSGLL